MGFPQSVADEVLVKCGRHCCLCGKYAGLKIELHHIKQAADGGEDTADNCIPLCLDCHAEVGSYNTRHPKGRKFTEKELKGHRDKYYALFSNMPQHVETKENCKSKEEPVFPTKDGVSTAAWGYPDFDKVLPLLPGKMILVAGYAGTRKSTYVHHILNTNLCRSQRVAYCCLKESPLEVSYEIIAEGALINSYNLKCGRLSEQDMQKIAMSKAAVHSKNLVLFPPNKFTQSKSVLDVIECSGADIVVIDDLNGLLLEDATIERFMYQLKGAAARSGTIVFVIYNLSAPRKRMDMRPVLDDLPSDSYYRLFDIVQFMYRPSTYYYDKSISKEVLEVIIAKGLPGDPTTVKMFAPSNITGVFAYEEAKAQ